MDLIDLIHREAIAFDEPTACDHCNRLAERGHVTEDHGWQCLDCCASWPERAVATVPDGGQTHAYIGAERIGTVSAPFISPDVDRAVAELLGRWTA